MSKSIIFSLIITFLMLTMPQDNKAAKLQSEFFDKYKPVVERMIYESKRDNSSWKRLAYLCDHFGPRISGSQNLENALHWLYSELIRDGFANVKMENVMVPKWVRGNEYCEMQVPYFKKLHMLAQGGSVATPPECITAPILVVSSFDDLKAKAAQAKGKIVVYNEVYTGYGPTVQYRVNGAVKAAEVGAVASLIRSVSPVGMQNAHTGVMHYEDSIPKIPHGALTLEDTQMLNRLQEDGVTPVLKIYMEARTEADAESHNLMAEIVGSEKPDEIIALGGHSDSWDVGSGAQDDGGGIVTAWEALKLIKKLGLKPKRTIRVVMWVNEENGTRGGEAYAVNHKDENHKMVFEFDSGVFPPSSIGFTTSDSTQFNYVKSNLDPFLKMLDTLEVRKGGGGVDIGPTMKLGVPGMSLNTNDRGKYFWYHHSAADMPDNVDPGDMNKCVAAMAITAFIYSELP